MLSPVARRGGGGRAAIILAAAGLAARNLQRNTVCDMTDWRQASEALGRAGAAAGRGGIRLLVGAFGLIAGIGLAIGRALAHPAQTARAAREFAAIWAPRASSGLNLLMLASAPFVAIFVPHLPDDLDLWNVARPASITLLDRHGEELATRGAVYGETIALEDLPDYFRDAFLATEDRRFYEHSGYDPRSLARALIANIRSGGVVQGGSTITQQLAKNLFLSSDQKITRKIHELFLAIWIERRHDKDEILSLYLNRIYLGSGAYGVEAASRYYFGKPAREATLAEAAMLAGLPKAPSSLAPTRNLAAAQARAAEVLDNLGEADAATEFQIRMAKARPAVAIDQPADGELGYFFDYIAARALELLGGLNRDIVVHTTLDRRLQLIAQTALSGALDSQGAAANVGQGALVAFDRIGGVVAMVGGKSYRESQFNRAVQAKRQPGSAFKPAVYLAALEAGMNPKTRFTDKPVEIEDYDWAPENYSGEHIGEVRLAEAMAKSINSVAVQITQALGVEKIAEAAHRLGVASPLTLRPSLALGASEVTVYEMTAAYLPFVAEGAAPAPYAISKITDRSGNALFERAPPAPAQVISKDDAEAMTHMLYQVIHSGTGRAARLGSRDAAGKTGTTQDWRDAWFIGYTADYVAGVWVGNDDYTPTNKVTGGGLPARIWRDFMGPAHADIPFHELAGAYPSVDWERERRLLNFYSDLEASFLNATGEGPAGEGGVRSFWPFRRSN